MRWLVVFLLALVVMAALWCALGRQITQDVRALPLGACDLALYQSRHVVALACSGRDLIRVWPLPVISPWFEDPLDPTTGQSAFEVRAGGS